MAKFAPFRARRVRMQILNYDAHHPAARMTSAVIVDAHSYSIAFIFSLAPARHFLRSRKRTHRFDRGIRAR